MAGIAVVAAGTGDGAPVDVTVLAGSVRALTEAGWSPVVVTPAAAPASSIGAPSCLVGPPGAPAPSDAGLGRALTLALGESRAGRRAVPVSAHVLIDPLDPALAHPPAMARPEPLAILEAEGISALVRSGFAVVVADQTPVVPDGPLYRSAVATLDGAAYARRVAGDLGAGVLAFVTDDDGPPFTGDIGRGDAEQALAADGSWTAEVLAAVRFLRAGGELAVITTAAALPAALSSNADPVPGALRIHRTAARPRSGAPALAAGWC